jgi:hypothetical protein
MIADQIIMKFRAGQLNLHYKNILIVALSALVGQGILPLEQEKLFVQALIQKAEEISSDVRGETIPGGLGAWVPESLTPQGPAETWLWTIDPELTVMGRGSNVPCAGSSP